MLAPETLLQNRYRIIRLLGQGGMGAVYEALDERLDTTVALKETLFADERLRKQFEREARLLARMHHPALPRVSDHFAEGEGQFLVMQFIPGDDLSQMMPRKQGPFPADQVLTWGDQLLDALDYLHTQDPQIIHRDIKPQNLKLTGRGQIILLDFGLAKGQTGGVSVVTTSASIYGYTPNYAPLEQIQGLGTDARSDIYALGATLYHLMTAVKPPDALSRAAALVNGQPDPLAPANEISRNIGPEVANVLARSLMQNREQRYPTAAAMRSALKGTEEAATLVGRSEAATILHAPSPATLASAQTSSTAPTTLRPGETTVVHTPNRRTRPWAIAVAALLLVGVLFGAFYAYQRRNNSSAVEASKPGEMVTPSQVDPTPAASQSPQHAEEKKAVADSSPIIVAESAKKNEKPSKKNQRAEKTPADADDDPSVEVTPPDPTSKGMPNTPQTPPVFVPRLEGLKQLGTTKTRSLPGGGQVTILGDGTRIVTMPNGTQQVIPPAGKVLRRRPLRNRY
ncbi:MAG TPA: protein kinase [Pyrinomonadaceae bacterium]|jgi:serine/threonine protein kinase